MKTPTFEYHRPATVEEALALLAEFGDDAKLLAGGQSLVPLLSLRLARPAHLIDLAGIDGLADIAAVDGGIRIGAMVRERAAERSPLVADQLPLLAEALPHIGHQAIRNRGTVGGSIAHADAAAEIPTVALALDAGVHVTGPSGERTIRAGDLFEGFYTTAISDDEILLAVTFPTMPSGSGWSFQEIARRHGDFALVGVGAVVSLEAGGTVAAASIALMGVADRPIRVFEAEAALVGADPDPSTITAVAVDAAAALAPHDDVHGSAAYRRHLAKVVIERSLTTAALRATTSTGAPA